MIALCSTNVHYQKIWYKIARDFFILFKAFECAQHKEIALVTPKSRRSEREGNANFTCRSFSKRCPISMLILTPQVKLALQEIALFEDAARKVTQADKRHKAPMQEKSFKYTNVQSETIRGKSTTLGANTHETSHHPIICNTLKIFLGGLLGLFICGLLKRSWWLHNAIADCPVLEREHAKLSASKRADRATASFFSEWHKLPHSHLPRSFRLITILFQASRWQGLRWNTIPFFTISDFPTSVSYFSYPPFSHIIEAPTPECEIHQDTFSFLIKFLYTVSQHTHFWSRTYERGWNLVEFGGIWWFGVIWWDLVGIHGIWWDLMGFDGIWWDLLGSGGIWWDLEEFGGI